MKVSIGKYPTWFGPYHLCDFLQKFGLSEKTTDKIAEKLPVAPFNWFQRVFQNNGEQKAYVHIDKYDIWNADFTMARIIHPILVRLKEDKMGISFVEHKDVPKEMRIHRFSNRAKELNEHYSWSNEGAFAEEYWHYVLDEMIFAFDSILKEDDIESTFFDKHITTYKKEEYEAHHARVRNGTTLFGKYYQALWT